LPHVQFWEAENSRRLDSSYRGGHRRDIPCVVDASDVRAVNAVKSATAWSMSEIAMLRELSDAALFNVLLHSNH
jgi:ribosomal protein S26